jgi:hypothetical protein
MPSAAYFRRQADICLRLALIASDEEVSNRLIMMVREYTTKGDALAGRVDPPPGADRRASAESGREEAALPPAPNGADSAADC